MTSARRASPVDLHRLKQQLRRGVALEAQEAATAAVMRVLAMLLESANACEAGILTDRDPEYLHHYRVCLRKARSLAGLFKKDLGPDRFARLALRLREFAAATGDLRDLDVFLASRDAYSDRLPAALRPDLAAVFGQVERLRTTSWQQLAERLGGSDYRRQMEALANSLDGSVSAPVQHALRPRVDGKILRQYRRICHAAALDTGDSELHRLRIECKKLRYLLELFGELYPAQIGAKLIEHLKTLQDALGEHHDSMVQRELLDRRVPAGEPGAKRRQVHGALGQLLAQRRDAAGERAVKQLAVFASAEVGIGFQALCGAA